MILYLPNTKICVARKPLSEKTIIDNILKWGTGCINIDGCRVGTESTIRPTGLKAFGQDRGWNKHNNRNIIAGSSCGRFPANVIHSGDTRGFPYTKSGNNKPHKNKGENAFINKGKGFITSDKTGYFEGDEGFASRFFYEALTYKDLIDYLEKLITPPEGKICKYITKAI